MPTRRVIRSAWSGSNAGRDIGAYLIGDAVRRMRSAGEPSVALNVNIDNPARCRMTFLGGSSCAPFTARPGVQLWA
jgi:hypothetical protein